MRFGAEIEMAAWRYIDSKQVEQQEVPALREGCDASSHSSLERQGNTPSQALILANKKVGLQIDAITSFLCSFGIQKYKGKRK